MTIETFQALAIALGLGLLVGLQREWSARNIAGIRSFALISLFGAVLGIVSGDLGVWVVTAGLLAIAAQLVTTSVLHFQAGDTDPGNTTAVAALLMYGVGVALALGYTMPAVAVGGAVVVLLQWKEPLHKLVGQIREKDIRAIVQLVLIGLVVLPVLPNKAYDPYGVLNPFKIWLLVVLIVGISVCGYIVYRLVGGKAGALIGGVLGGIISSTATTVSYARHTRSARGGAGSATVVIMIASTVVFGRVLFEIGIVAPNVFYSLAPPLVAVMLFMAVLALIAFLIVPKGATADAIPDDPSQLKAAIVFGGLYALVVYGVAVAKEHLGEQGLYAVAAISGMTDMDAITLSTAQLVSNGTIKADVGWRLILVGSLANLVFKAFMVMLLGSRQLLWRVGLLFLIALVAGSALVILWPAGQPFV